MTIFKKYKKSLYIEWGRRGMHIVYWWESQKERDHSEYQDVGGWTILKIGWDDMDWTDLA
jgi:hypothetical protein